MTLLLSGCLVLGGFVTALAQAGNAGDGLPPDREQPLQHRAGDPGLPPPGAPSPWNNDVIVYRTDPSGNVKRAATFDRAGVPTIARLMDGRLIVAHQYFPANAATNFDKVALRFSSDEGKTWTGPEVLRLSGLPDGMRFPFDPTLVPLPDGRVRLYFTSLRGRRFNEDRPAIHSAISTNGVDYAFEPGVRFGIEERGVIDCAVVLHQGVFHLFAPDNGTQLQPGQRPGNEPAAARPHHGIGYHATSRDGLHFTRTEDVRMEGNRRWLGNAQSDGTLITFYGTGNSGRPTPGQPRGNLWLATSRDGNTWEPATGPNVPGGDPGAIRTRDGDLVIVITGEPRPGTPGSRPNRQQPRADDSGR